MLLEPSLQIEVLNKYLFLTSKPVIYLVNLSEKDYIRKKNKWYVLWKNLVREIFLCTIIRNVELKFVICLET